jgi:hypothetical protein
LKTFSISLIINDDYSGALFYKSTFTPCCGGTKDASLFMEVDGSMITSFDINQFLGSYRGGNCPTTASASGAFRDDIYLSLNPFPFSDCDGIRTVLKFELTRQ